MVFDFHIHSTLSDGHKTPKEIINLAYGLMAILDEEYGLFAICDHNNVSGIDAALEYVAAMNGVNGTELYFLPGVEADSGKGRHILGYFSPEERAWKRRAIQNIFDENEAARDERNKETIDRLNDVYKIYLDYDLLYGNDDGIKTRLPIVKAIVDRGYAPDIGSARKEYFDVGRPAFVEYVPPFSADEIVQNVADHALLIVIAHPHGVEESEVLDLMQSGLNGIEVMNGKTHFKELHDFARNKPDIFCTVGSDCHFVNGNNRFGYSAAYNPDVKEMGYYNISRDFSEYLERRVDSDILHLLNECLTP